MFVIKITYKQNYKHYFIIKRKQGKTNQIKKVWFPGSRKDYYEIHPELFTNTFQVNMQLVHSNILIAQKIKSDIDKVENNQLDAVKVRMNEMEEFYKLMEQHFTNFIEKWQIDKKNVNEK